MVLLMNLFFSFLLIPHGHKYKWNPIENYENPTSLKELSSVSYQNTATHLLQLIGRMVISQTFYGSTLLHSMKPFGYVAALCYKGRCHTHGKRENTHTPVSISRLIRDRSLEGKGEYIKGGTVN